MRQLFRRSSILKPSHAPLVHALSCVGQIDEDGASFDLLDDALLERHAWSDPKQEVSSSFDARYEVRVPDWIIEKPGVECYESSETSPISIAHERDCTATLLAEVGRDLDVAEGMHGNAGSIKVTCDNHEHASHGMLIVFQLRYIYGILVIRPGLKCGLKMLTWRCNGVASCEPRDYCEASCAFRMALLEGNEPLLHGFSTSSYMEVAELVEHLSSTYAPFASFVLMKDLHRVWLQAFTSVQIT